MKVIPFPAPTAKKQKRLTPDKTGNRPLLTGSWTFSCTNCSQDLEFSTNTIVFRKIDFFCNKCGQHHTVNNPAFSENYENKKSNK